MNEPLKILLVDDDRVDRMAVRRVLDRAGLQPDIVEVETCAAAIAQFQQEDFDCVLLDYRLPDGDGLSLIQQMRQRQYRAATIVLTGQGDEEVAVQLMKAGAHDYIAKSKITPESLARSLTNAVRVQRAEVAAAEATQRLRDSEERYRLVLEGSNDGVWDWYICQNEVYCNDRLFEIVGLAREQLGTAQEAFLRLIHPDDRPRVLRAITSHIHRGDPFDVEFRLLHVSGEFRYCTSRGKAQSNAQNILFRMSGIVSDITEAKRNEVVRKCAEDEIVKLNRDLERRVTELQTLFDVLPIGIAIADDPECRQVRVNSTYAEILGISADKNASLTAPDAPALKAFSNGLELTANELPMERAVITGKKVLNAEIDFLRADGKIVNLVSYTTPLFDEQGQTRGSIGAFLDITDRQAALRDRQQEEVAQRFLAEASSLLTASLDSTAILQSLAQLCTAFLADFCFFDLIDSRGILRRVAWHHADPSRQDWFNQVQDYVPDRNSLHPIAACLATELPVIVSSAAQEWLTSIAQSPKHLQFMQDLCVGSVLTVPLMTHDRTLGTLTFGLSTEFDRRYSQTDLRLAADLAQRTALAVDNAHLYRSTQEAEHNLRQALVILGQHQQQLRTLQRLTDLLNQRLTNLPELLRVLVEAIRDAIPKAEFGVMVLQNPYTDLLELATASGIEPEQLQLQEPIAPGEGLLGQIFLTGQSRLLHSTTPGTPASLAAVAIESVQAGRLGVLAVGNWSHEAFSDDDLQLLMAFGEQAAIALTNAQLIQALEEREERLAAQNRILGSQNRELEWQRQQIQLQNLKLREAARLKSQFIATMSHELRTPMNAVIGFSQLLIRQRQLNPQQNDMVERILNNGKNLLALINDILDLSKIEAGRLELKAEQLNLTVLTTATVNELRSLAEQKNLILQVQASLTNPQVINDSTRLRQILVNLLSNAIKFTETGSVQVRVEEVDADTIVLVVQDTGIGIAEADITHIFEEFHQVDQTLAKRFAGTGLGLTITDLLVRMMNGKISVESELGKGSTFRVEIPRKVE